MYKCCPCRWSLLMVTISRVTFINLKVKFYAFLYAYLAQCSIASHFYMNCRQGWSKNESIYIRMIKDMRNDRFKINTFNRGQHISKILEFASKIKYINCSTHTLVYIFVLHFYSFSNLVQIPNAGDGTESTIPNLLIIDMLYAWKANVLMLTVDKVFKYLVINSFFSVDGN